MQTVCRARFSPCSPMRGKFTYTCTCTGICACVEYGRALAWHFRSKGFAPLAYAKIRSTGSHKLRLCLCLAEKQGEMVCPITWQLNNWPHAARA